MVVDGVDGMNEVNLASPVNSVSVPMFIEQSLYMQPTIVKELNQHVGKICVIEPQNSMRKNYVAFQCLDHTEAMHELRSLTERSKFTQRIGSMFVLLDVAVDSRNNILLKCFSAEPEEKSPLLYWTPFYQKNMKISAIAL